VHIKPACKHVDEIGSRMLRSSRDRMMKPIPDILRQEIGNNTGRSLSCSISEQKSVQYVLDDAINTCNTCNKSLGIKFTILK